MGYLRIFISRDIRLKVFKKLQDLDMSYHISHSTGNTISILKRGDSAVDDAIVIFHMFLWGPLITFSISLAILWGIH
jgi:ABC-type multidrug transport system fused ATPase/permease subunit